MSLLFTSQGKQFARMTMAILFNNDGSRHVDWMLQLQSCLPGRTIHEYPDIPDINDIEYAIVWNHPKGDLARYPNLKAIFSTGAGTEHFDQDPNVPYVPVIRLIDPTMADDMALYTLYWILHFQRHFETYRTQQDTAHWERYPSRKTENFNICVLGLGAIGSIIATKLSMNGYNVTGWSRRQKNIEGVSCVAGQDALKPALGQADVLVNVLPLTEATRGLLNRERLIWLKRGAFVINISRGPIIEDAALLGLLDTEHITAAALDVFDQEPLYERSAYWSHPDVHVTPHMSGATNPDTAARIIADSIQCFERGETLEHRWVRP